MLRNAIQKVRALPCLFLELFYFISEEPQTESRMANQPVYIQSLMAWEWKSESCQHNPIFQIAVIYKDTCTNHSRIFITQDPFLLVVLEHFIASANPGANFVNLFPPLDLPPNTLAP
jgi:hypothetical protein